MTVKKKRPVVFVDEDAKVLVQTTLPPETAAEVKRRAGVETIPVAAWIRRLILKELATSRVG
jgi:hypothetical protein